MRELEKTEIETVAGGHRGDLGHALAEGGKAFLATRNIITAAQVFIAHYEPAA